MANGGMSDSDALRMQVYVVTVGLVEHAEQIRQNRFNTYLVLASICIASWAGILVGKDDLPWKSLILCGLCVPGFVCGVLWSVLAHRSSDYLDDFHAIAENLESLLPDNIPKPMQASAQRRERAKNHWFHKRTTTRYLLTNIPKLFAILFFAFGIASWVVV